jgi:hypothetical protein
MTLEVIRTAPRLVARGRAIMLGAAVSLVCSACASEDQVATTPEYDMPSMAAYKPPKPPQQQVATASPSSPQPTDGASLTSGVANAPAFTR